MANKNFSIENLEPEVQRLARTLFQKAAEHKPTLFETRDLLGRMIEKRQAAQLSIGHTG